MFTSRMLLRVPGQSLYLKTQIRGFGLTCAVLEPPRKVVPPPPPPPPSKRTTKKAEPPEPEKPATRRRLVLSDQKRNAAVVKSRPLAAKEKEQRAKEKEREKARKLKEKQAEKLQAEKEKKALKKILQKPYPPPPKRPLTSYLHFFMDVQNTVPGESATSRAVATSEKWKALSEAEKQEYAKKSEQNRIRYQSELADWIASLNAAQLKAARSNKEPGTMQETAFDQLPRRPPNAYALFFKDYVARPEIANKAQEAGKKLGGGDMRAVIKHTAGARGRLTGEQWRKMSDKEKQVYLDKAEQLKKEYQASYGDLIAQQQKAAERAATL